MLQQSHDQVVVPLPIEKRRFALPPLNPEAAFLIGSYGAFVDRQNAQRDAVQLKLREGKAQDPSGRFGADPLSEVLGPQQANSK